MNMQTLAKDATAAQNYTAVTFNQQVQARSIVKGYFLNRQGIEDTEHKLENPLDKYGRNAGMEYNFTDKSGRWNAWTGYHQSFKESIKKPQYYSSAGGGYFGKKLTSFIDVGTITDNYYTDMGFVSRIENYDAQKDTMIRKGFNQFYNETKYTLFPAKGQLNQIKFGMENFTVLNLNNSLNESDHGLKLQFSFKNTAEISFNMGYNLNNLLFHTTYTDKDPIPPGAYSTWRKSISYGSDYRKKFYYSASILQGGLLNGSIFRYNFTASYRVQPWGNFAINLEQSRLKFPEPYGNNNLFLVAPRIEINFSNNLFWTTFLQYNNQRNNFNINSRLQWRYKPMSDLFLVYSDNYFTDPFMKNKNRAIVFKMNYWLNL